MNAPTPLVLLHGWGLHPTVWTPLIAALQAIDPQRPILCPALPAHPGGPSITSCQLDDWAEAMLPHLPPRYHLAGWSLGGQVALALAARQPAGLVSLSLLGTGACFVSQPACPHGLPAATVDDFLTRFASDAPATQKRFLALQGLGDRQRRHVMAILGEHIVSLQGTEADFCSELKSALLLGLQTLANSNLTAALSSIQVPVRVLHGAEDALMPLAGAVWLNDQLAEARLSVLAGTGHAPFISAANTCASWLVAHLAESEAQA